MLLLSWQLSCLQELLWLLTRHQFVFTCMIYSIIRLLKWSNFFVFLMRKYLGRLFLLARLWLDLKPFLFSLRIKVFNLVNDTHSTWLFNFWWNRWVGFTYHNVRGNFHRECRFFEVRLYVLLQLFRMTRGVAPPLTFSFFKLLSISLEVRACLRIRPFAFGVCLKSLLLGINTLKRIGMHFDDLLLKRCVNTLWVIALPSYYVGPIAVVFLYITRIFPAEFSWALAVAWPSIWMLVAAALRPLLGWRRPDAGQCHPIFDLLLAVYEVLGESVYPLLFDIVAIGEETVAALGDNELEDVLPQLWLLWRLQT